MPTLEAHDCRPYVGGADAESCTLPNTGETTWYISVHGYEAGSYAIQAILE